MPDYATEMVAEHSFRLQPSINLHGSVSAFMFSGDSSTGALPRMNENSGIPCAVILKPYSILAHTQDLTPVTGFVVRRSEHYTTTANPNLI